MADTFDISKHFLPEPEPITVEAEGQTWKFRRVTGLDDLVTLFKKAKDGAKVLTSTGLPAEGGEKVKVADNGIATSVYTLALTSVEPVLTPAMLAQLVHRNGGLFGKLMRAVDNELALSWGTAEAEVFDEQKNSSSQATGTDGS